ncbi:tRNA lysidine(34) synthetase TilS [Lignipirellula cremea]|uniref:tRNA(Ile)-lysidine synthase n=1 Tax=Lignipirellula cremea TaxID=2528010 RepID=A0A518DWU0_9BACT|nr:tRNA lysidine(34) synthetase TilS [Lignipirellula cremea]QDU96302.1 tRNA(Ile)-lysidine synthase [Lignipirellula cremea]
MTNDRHPFEQRLATAWPAADWRNVSLLLAVSGGADSVALLKAMIALKQQEGGSGTLFVAHFNHRLRPTAGRDEQFVRDLCRSINVACETGRTAAGDAEAGRAGTVRSTPAQGVEAEARERRYAFLLATAERLGARWILTGHTADDQAETILHRILRGTGVAGLAGIPRYRVLNEAVVVARPMLDLTRSEILAYLAHQSQAYCNDETNQQTHFTRNRLRHELLPQLRDEYNPAIDVALRRLGSLAEETQAVVSAAAAALYDRAATPLDDGVSLSIAELTKAPSLLVRELFKSIWKQQHWDELEMGYQQWLDLEAMLHVRDDRRSLPDGVIGEKRAGRLILRRPAR